MTRDELLDSIRARAGEYLDKLTTAGLPGSVIVAIHRDSSGVKKVNVSVEESWHVKDYV